MKISGHNPSELLTSKTPAANTPKAQAEAAQAATSAASNPGVAVVLTSARALGKDGANNTAEVDTRKVAAMRAAIADGSFVVNPEAIADKLLSNAQEMLPGTKR